MVGREACVEVSVTGKALVRSEQMGTCHVGRQQAGVGKGGLSRLRGSHGKEPGL